MQEASAALPLSQRHEREEVGVLFGHSILGQACPLVCLEKRRKKEGVFFSLCVATRYKALCGVFSGLGGTEPLCAWTGGRRG